MTDLKQIIANPHNLTDEVMWEIFSAARSHSEIYDSSMNFDRENNKFIRQLAPNYKHTRQYQITQRLFR